MNTKDTIYKQLRSEGQRITKQKKLVLDILLENMNYMLSASQIIELMKSSKMDTATVYRILQAFSDTGVIESLLSPDGVTKYKICEHKPHHHMICKYCGKIINFPCAERLWDKYLEENNFTEESHKIEIYGKCEECSLNDD